MNNLIKLTKLPSAARLALSRPSIRCSSHTPSVHKDHKDGIIFKGIDNYQVPLRPVSHDDMMIPYGSFDEALAAERRLAHNTLKWGIVKFMIGCVIFYESGVLDSLWWPNLDNIMQDTEQYVYDLEDRVAPRPDDD